MTPAFHVTAIELVIEGQAYRAERSPDGRAWALAKWPGGTTIYFVTPTDCGCPHSQYRKPAEGCKHRQALAAIGIDRLLPLTPPQAKE